MCNDDLVRLLSIRERKEAVEEQLKWIALQQTAIDNIYAQQKTQLAQLRDAELKKMADLIQEERKEGKHE